MPRDENSLIQQQQQPQQSGRSKSEKSQCATGTTRTEADLRRVGFLIRDEDLADIDGFLERYPQCRDEYIPVAVIGEGTFSTVYKAIDVCHYERDNSSWMGSSRQDSWDVARFFALVSAMEQLSPIKSSSRSLVDRTSETVFASPLYAAIRWFVLKEYADALDSNGSLNLDHFKILIQQKPPVFVAIKRINATSGPKRIAEEISFLKMLQGKHHVIPVTSALRWEDQVIVISPYFAGIDFRDLLSVLRASDVAGYMRLLLEALAHVHSLGIMHRDVKPSNFLFSRERDGSYRGMLVDFGLAQMEEKDVNKRPRTAPRVTSATTSTSSSHQHGHHQNQQHVCPESLCGENLANVIRDLPPGWIEHDPRVPMKASRAGTRGFRAPEVLFKVAHQSVAIDVWSAGVIMLTLLTRRYPFFHSTDDCDALAELACIFGDQEMSMAASKYDRIWVSGGLPSVPKHKLSWRHLCRQLNPSWTEQLDDAAFDLLDRLLDLDYTTRITALQALSHPYLCIN